MANFFTKNILVIGVILFHCVIIVSIVSIVSIVRGIKNDKRYNCTISCDIFKSKVEFNNQGSDKCWCFVNEEWRVLEILD